MIVIIDTVWGLSFLGRGYNCGDYSGDTGADAPIAQMADIGFKVVLLERLNQKWKQKHF